MAKLPPAPPKKPLPPPPKKGAPSPPPRDPFAAPEHPPSPQEMLEPPRDPFALPQKKKRATPEELLAPPRDPLALPRPKTPPKKAPARPRPRAVEPVPAPGKSPPLFIKIDKYRDVVNQLQHLKSYALSLRDALDALSDLERELQNGISVTHKALDKFNEAISTLDTKITRITPSEVDAPPHLDTTEMDDYVKQLHEQMERIKQDLKNASF